MQTTSPDHYPEEEIMSLEVPGTSDLTKKRRVRGGHKSHVTKVLGQSAVLLADQLSDENGLQLRQQKSSWRKNWLQSKFWITKF